LQVILSGLSVLALWYEAPRARFIAFVVFYGILAGGYNALLPTTITEVYGTQNYARVNGFIYFIRGLGAIFGAPIAGVILGSHKRGAIVNMGLGALQKRYNDVVIYDAALLLAAGM
jgi:MFS family permease